MDRDSRLMLSFGYYLGLLVRARVKVGFAREDITSLDPPEKLFMLSLHSYKAEADGHTTVRNLAEGRIRRAAAGYFPFHPGHGFWCYRYIPSQKKRGGAFLELIPERAEWLRRWYQWLQEGVSADEITRRMNASGVLTHGGGPWTHPTIISILKHSALRGKYVIGGKGPMAGVTIPTPAIFTEEEGREIDRMIARNKAQARRNARTEYALSRGYIFCACGSPMWGRRITNWGRTYERYMCPRCGRGTGRAWIETAVKEALLPIFTNPARLRKALDERRQTQPGELEGRLSLLEGQIRRKAGVLENLKRQHLWGDWDDQSYLRERDKHRAELETLRGEKAWLEQARRESLEQERDGHRRPSGWRKRRLWWRAGLPLPRVPSCAWSMRPSG